MNNTAIITGVTGQDGSYLSELLLSRSIRVVGVRRRASTSNLGRVEHLLGNPLFQIEEGDISDPHYVLSSLLKYKPKYVFNLAAQSHVHTSFSQPGYTFDVTGKAVLNYLEAIKMVDKNIRFYQASSSEMFGNSISYYESDYYENRIDGIYDTFLFKRRDIFQDEFTPFNPQSPYAIAKLAAHHLVRLYRESYGLFACSGILFNHESERRGDQFVTKKITNYIKDYIYKGKREKLELGNLTACRDWGHAEDYVQAMLLMLEADKPDDYVVGTGETHSVEEFLKKSFNLAGLNIERNVLIRNSLFRPAEVPFLKARPVKVQETLGWKPKITFEKLIERMVYK